MLHKEGRVQKEKGALSCAFFFLVRETGLEPVRDYHTPLKRARLPIPPLSHGLVIITLTFISVNIIF